MQVEPVRHTSSWGPCRDESEIANFWSADCHEMIINEIDRRTFTLGSYARGILSD